MSAEAFVYPNGTKSEPSITGNYGPRQSLWTPGGWTANFHYGTDMVGWSTICSPVDGVVIFAGYSGGFGNLVKVRDEYGDEWWHAHLAPNSFRVGYGARVKAGQALATMGTTGKSTGVHLHWEFHPNGGAARDARVEARNRIAAAAAVDVKPFVPKVNNQEDNVFNLIVRKASGGTKAFFVVPNTTGKDGAKPYIAMVIDGPAPEGIPTYNASGQWSEPYVTRYIENVNFN